MVCSVRALFGIRESNSKYEIIGVIEADKLQNSFLNELRAGNKFNQVISVQEHMLAEGDNTLLIFYIPEVRRQDKPIYLNGDIRLSYIRKGACDVKCSDAELKRFIIDASSERYDSQTVSLNPDNCFDTQTIRWYRNVLNNKNPGQYESYSDLDFLHHWGFVVDHENKLIPTRAGILLFGSGPAFHRILPRPVVDCQWIPYKIDEMLPDQRWTDRLVVEDNLLLAWQKVSEYYLKHAEIPFQIENSTFQRKDTPPDYIAFREAVINLLIHQDYSDHTRKPSIRFFRDQTIFWNPGDAFVSEDELLEPGEKEVRNPRIVAAFRRIGLSEQAGTGCRTIFRNWQSLGNIPPIICSDKAEKTFELRLIDKELISEEQILFQAGLGVHLSEPEAKAFAYLCRKRKLRLIDVKMVNGMNGADAKTILERLSLQGLVTPVTGASDSYYLLAEHLQAMVLKNENNLVTDQLNEKSENLVTDQPDVIKNLPEVLKNLNETQWKVIMLCDVPRSITDIMENVGLKSRTYFRNKHLSPLLKGGVLQMTHADEPNHPNQAYILSEHGINLKAKKIGKRS
ncbi:ATP-binding protein [Desulfobacterales bacterium HSG17]|nr:ATP-binding protein [Desulfobacterales bacterium HSG17]